jgi:hypothetical protein
MDGVLSRERDETRLSITHTLLELSSVKIVPEEFTKVDVRFMYNLEAGKVHPRLWNPARCQSTSSGIVPTLCTRLFVRERSLVAHKLVQV